MQFIALSTTLMKTLFTLLLIFFTYTYIAQTTDSPTQNVSMDENVNYRLFSTKNMYTFIKLDTRNGRLWQVQWSTKGEDYRFENVLSITKLVDDVNEKSGRFFLYPTTNMYNFILLDQIDGRSWQVQWSTDEDNRMVLKIL